MAMDLTMNHILSTLSSPVKKKKYVLIGLFLTMTTAEVLNKCGDKTNCLTNVTKRQEKRRSFQTRRS